MSIRKMIGPGLAVIVGSLALVGCMGLFPSLFGLYVDLQVIAHVYTCQLDAPGPGGEQITLTSESTSPAALICPTLPIAPGKASPRYGASVIMIEVEGGTLYRLNLGRFEAVLDYPVGRTFRVTLRADSPIRFSDVEPLQ